MRGMSRGSDSFSLQELTLSVSRISGTDLRTGRVAILIFSFASLTLVAGCDGSCAAGHLCATLLTALLTTQKLTPQKNAGSLVTLRIAKQKKKYARSLGSQVRAK